MDRAVLVRGGHALMRLLEAKGLVLCAAVWVYDSQSETWKLWVVPKARPDKHLFYRIVAELFSQHRELLNGIDPSDIELREAAHPALVGLAGLTRVSGMQDVTVDNNLLNDYYLPDGIILMLDL